MIANNFPYKRILILGPSGAGKSYFSRELHDITDIPLYHLDILFWKPNWVETPRDEFIKIQEEILSRDSFIIDGTYAGTLPIRLAKCDCVFLFDIDIDECISNVSSRIGKEREDLPSYLEEKEDPEFINWIKTYPTKHKPYIEKLLDQYPNIKVIRFPNREEKDRFINTLK